jgi:capsular polysaccharide transport system permease protein
MHNSQRSFATFRTIGALILREMSSRYGRTPGGYVWALIEPLGIIVILAMGFSLLVRVPSLGTSFFLFYATGFLPFNMYQSVSVFVARSIQFSRPLLFYPSVTWLDAIFARFILNTLTALMVTYVLLSFIIMGSNAHVVVSIEPIVQALCLAALLGLGIGTINCFLIGVVPVWDIIWSIVTRPLFLASGVMFIYEDMPTAVQNILWYNPVMHITALMRMGFYPMYNPSYVSFTFVIVVSLTSLTLGLLFLRKNYRRILNF